MFLESVKSLVKSIKLYNKNKIMSLLTFWVFVNLWKWVDLNRRHLRKRPWKDIAVFVRKTLIRNLWSYKNLNRQGEAAIAPWFRLCLLSCGPGFDPKHIIFAFFNLYWNCNEKRVKINKKEARIWPIYKILTDSNSTLFIRKDSYKYLNHFQNSTELSKVNIFELFCPFSDKYFDPQRSK